MSVGRCIELCFTLPDGDKHLDRGGLARPVGAEQAKDLTGIHRQGQTRHRRERAEAADQVFCFENNVIHGFRA